MKKTLLIICFCLLAMTGCKNRDNITVTQDVDISNCSDIENCDIKFNLSTYVWQNSNIIYNTRVRNIPELDLEKTMIMEKNKVLKITNCISVLMRTLIYAN